MKRHKNKITLIISLLLAVIIFLIGSYSFLYVRKIITDYAKNQAALLVFKIANTVINEVVSSPQTEYNKIVNLSKNSENSVTALEIDIVRINKLKTEISAEIAKRVAEESKYVIGIPIGTLLSNEYTLGMGPTISFNMQLQANAVTDFSSTFSTAGINQVLHQIVITVQIGGSLVIPWSRASFSTKTSAIAAQTVITGIVPDAYTSVIGDGTDKFDDTVDNIFNFGQ